MVRHPHDKAESKYNPDAGISKEDEERYQKLLLENEDLQRLIVQVSGYHFDFYYKNSTIDFNMDIYLTEANFNWLQKEEKIRLLRQQLAERDASTQNSSGNVEHSDANVNPTAITPNIAQGKDALLIIQADPTTTSDFDSAIGGGLSIVTRASQSDVEFSESYLWDGKSTTNGFQFNWNALYFINDIIQ